MAITETAIAFCTFCSYGLSYEAARVAAPILTDPFSLVLSLVKSTPDAANIDENLRG